MIITKEGHMIIKNCFGKKPMELRYPKISMVRKIYLFILQ